MAPIAATPSVTPTRASDTALAIDAGIQSYKYARANHPCLVDVTLRVRPGELILVTGRSGAGKSTLCHCLAGAIPGDFGGEYHGTVRVAGRDLASLRPPEISRFVGLMIQAPESQLFCATVDEEVAFGPENLGLERPEIRHRVASALDLVGLTGFERRSTTELSGGEKQRVALAGVLACDPPVLVLDQPAAELDPAGRRRVYAALARLCRQRGKTIVIVDHRIEEVGPLASRVVELREGRIVADDCCSGSLEWVGPVSEAAPVRDRTRIVDFDGRSFGSRDFDGHCGPVCELRGVSFRYPGADRWALSDVSLSIDRGETVSLVGANGSGKSTLARHLIGLLRPTRGQVFVGGRNIAGVSTARLSDDIGFLFQDPDYQIFADSVFGEAAYAARLRHIAPAEVSHRVEESLRQVGLWERRDDHPYTLSQGERRRLAFASILAHSPRILVVDEPTAGLDHGSGEQLLEVFAEFSARDGTVLFVTHDASLIRRHADRTVELSAGRVVGTGHAAGCRLRSRAPISQSGTNCERSSTREHVLCGGIDSD